MSETAVDIQQASHEEAIEQIIRGRSPIDEKLLAWSDWFNPIVIKETRQAFKSRQFIATFSLTLIAVLFWTVAAIILTVPGIYYLPGGPTLMTGYLFILMVPVCLVVPVTAFRSMSSELEDGTHDILSLCTLTSRQVVVGKLMVALLQTLIYCSAIVPCIAMTYLLRGIGLGTLCFIVVGTIGWSILFSALAILFATVGRTRDTQVLMTLLLFTIVVPTSFFWISIVIAIIYQNAPVDRYEFWMATLICFAFGISYVVLSILAAAAKIGFASENHSTRIRWLLLIQHCMYLWVACGFASYLPSDGDEVLLVMTSLLGVHWTVVGTLIIGERSVITPRMQRLLPRSTFGRVFRTWFNPGSGSGYVFSVCTFASTILIVGVFQAHATRMNQNWDASTIFYVIALTSYLALYLGIARAILLFFGNPGRSKMLLSTILVVLLVLLGSMVPIMISYWSSGFFTVTYELYTFTAPFWTLAKVADNDGTAEIGALILMVIAVIVFACNLLFSYRDVMLMRIETPKRVQDETMPASSAKRMEADAEIDPLGPTS